MTRTPRAATASIIVSATLGEYALLITPFIVTAMTRAYGISESLAGQFISVELFSMGVAGFLLSYRVQRWPARNLIALGLALVLIGNLACAYGAGPQWLWPGRALAGLGEGMLMAVAGAAGAVAANPQRLFSQLGFVIAFVATVALIAAPTLIDWSGPRAVFLFLALSTVAGFALVAKFPGARAPAASSPVAASAMQESPAFSAASASAPSLSAFRVRGALASLIGFALLWVGASAVWVFAEGIGTHQGLTLAQIGFSLAVGQVAGLIGPVIAARSSVGAALERSILIGNLGMAAGALLMIFTANQLGYTAGASLMSIGAMFLAPAFRLLMARIDGSGAVNAMSVPFYTFGFGAAPLFASGLSLETRGYGSLAWLAVSAFVVSGVLTLTVSRRSSGSS